MPLNSKHHNRNHRLVDTSLNMVAFDKFYINIDSKFKFKNNKNVYQRILNLTMKNKIIYLHKLKIKKQESCNKFFNHIKKTCNICNLKLKKRY